MINTETIPSVKFLSLHFPLAKGLHKGLQSFLSTASRTDLGSLENQEPVLVMFKWLGRDRLQQHRQKPKIILDYLKCFGRDNNEICNSSASAPTWNPSHRSGLCLGLLATRRVPFHAPSKCPLPCPLIDAMSSRMPRRQVVAAFMGITPVAAGPIFIPSGRMLFLMFTNHEISYCRTRLSWSCCLCITGDLEKLAKKVSMWYIDDVFYTGKTLPQDESIALQTFHEARSKMYKR